MIFLHLTNIYTSVLCVTTIYVSICGGNKQHSNQKFPRPNQSRNRRERKMSPNSLLSNKSCEKCIIVIILLKILPRPQVLHKEVGQRRKCQLMEVWTIFASVHKMESQIIYFLAKRFRSVSRLSILWRMIDLMGKLFL